MPKLSPKDQRITNHYMRGVRAAARAKATRRRKRIGAGPKPKRRTYALRASRHHNSKLTPAQVRAIRSAIRSNSATIRGVARKFGLAPSTVHSLVHGLTYADID